MCLSSALATLGARGATLGARVPAFGGRALSPFPGPRCSGHGSLLGTAFDGSEYRLRNVRDRLQRLERFRTAFCAGATRLTSPPFRNAFCHVTNIYIGLVSVERKRLKCHGLGSSLSRCRPKKKRLTTRGHPPRGRHLLVEQGRGSRAEPRIHASVGQLAPPLALQDLRSFRGAVLRACSARALQVRSDTHVAKRRG